MWVKSEHEKKTIQKLIESERIRRKKKAASAAVSLKAAKPARAAKSGH
ncbi:MAG: hypothetical protein HQL35_03370 [Alphaproteobacteria bacterium]|nr:hypothetical protein [Alphaproteobacteria bacterium]